MLRVFYKIKASYKICVICVKISVVVLEYFIPLRSKIPDLSEDNGKRGSRSSERFWNEVA